MTRKQKVKAWTVKFLAELIYKIDSDYTYLKRISVTKEIRYTFIKHVPEDNLWHQAALKLEVWVKRTKTTKKSKCKNRTRYLDGAIDSFKIIKERKK